MKDRNANTSRSATAPTTYNKIEIASDISLDLFADASAQYCGSAHVRFHVLELEWDGICACACAYCTVAIHTRYNNDVREHLDKI